jgi:penicillin-binding protein 1A
MAHQAMIARYGREQAYTNGYKVYTTISSTLQLAAQQALKSNTMSYDQRHGYRGAVASLIDDSENNEDNTTQLKQTTETLSQQQIMQALANVESYNTLQPAVVIEVKETSAVITLNDGTIATIEWQGMAWARPYINDRKQGLAPKLASDILQYGDIIYVVTQENNYILSQLPAVSSALVALSPDNGAIQAAVGGFSFKESQFNRVTQAKRQVGSNIKPFLYSAALDHGFTLASLVNDVPINQWDKSTGQVWRPKNSPPTYSGEIRVKLALAQSKNVIAVRLLRAIGLDNVIPHIASFGFAPDDLPRNETLALGSAALTPLEMVSGFATFANGGFLIEPYIVDHIEDSYGAIVYQANPALACDDCSDLLSKQPPHHFPIDTAKNQQNENVVAKPEATQLTGELGVAEHQTVNKAERVISAQNAFLVTQALYTAIWGADWSNKPYWQGTGYRAQTLKRRDIAGKTGTTNSSRDAWFSGYSRRLVTTAWIGFDDPSKELGRTTKNKNLTTKQTFAGESGAKSAQPAWIDFMGTALQTLPVEPFIQPENIVSVRIDKSTGKLTDKTDKTSDFEFFMLGTTPIDYVRQDNSNEVIEGIENINDTDIF